MFTGGDQYQVGDIPVPVPTVRPATAKVRDANSGTFYSSMANIDIEIGDGNPAAAGVPVPDGPAPVLRHMDFRLGSGFAGVYQAGNVMRGRPLPRRALWHRHRENLARLAVHPDRLHASTASATRRSASMRST
ncbi:hypothetical protein ACRAWD_27125 [Caulobacter segnis]